MTRSSHILLITPGFPADESDENCIPPLQVYLKNLLQSHPELSVEVVALHYPYTRKPYHWHGIQVHPMGGNNVPYPARLLFHRRAKRALRKLRKQHAFSKVHALWWGEPAMLGHWFYKRCKVPLSITLMGQDALPGNRYLRLVKAKSAVVVAVSDFHAETFHQTTGRTVDEVIPWGIDPAEFQIAGTDRPIDVLGVGSLIPLKQYDVFVDTIEQLVIDFPNLNTVIVGDGPEHENLKQRITQKSLQAHIELKGELPRTKALELMKQAKVFLHPSRYESLGYASLEALAAGCQVVSLRTGIAQGSDKWSVANSNQELTPITKTALSQIANRKSQIDHPITQTTSAYARLYTQ